ncbi:TetR/AcrR family transcriptional regulator [Glycomyces sp. NRRL B-16210]|uniref:TetR/AcrR family transcriptional regulator n=1 Tax=Glycomyces sp. NRRL B-16210 TaxID=1463821 RepID=UPI0004C28EA5|nr:TetR/AcrR family transcriptional regulator [Glycomyces sp. NRRL B-16210]
MIDDTLTANRIVEAADRLFYARGVQAVGMDAIRGEAGVSLKRIYSLFPSKDDLTVAVLHRRRDQWNAGIAASAENAETAREKLLAIFDFLDAWFREPDFHGCAFINVFGELSGGSEQVRQQARKQKQAFVDYVAQLVEDAGAPEELGPQIAILAEGAQTTAAILGGPEAAAQARAAAVTLLDSALERNASATAQQPG